MEYGNKTLDRIEEMIGREELGFLGGHVVHTAEAYSIIWTRQKNHSSISDAIEELKTYDIFVEFSLFRSSVEKAYLKQFNERNRPRNFTLIFDVRGSEIEQGQSHFSWNGSPEGLDHEMKRDSEVLNDLGFNITYNGYNPVDNVDF
ncbi:hypothetical protein GOV12_02485 [Candidatus Pacearchaeota archaeon]|nr:hypothetical protein [Candidatus Pacearchaeota archaeon]